MRHDSVLVLMDEQGKPHVEARPEYNEGIGPAISLWRVNGVTPEHLVTLRMPSANALVRKLPLVVSAAMRLESRAKKSAR
jgi:hypothetical protein